MGASHILLVYGSRSARRLGLLEKISHVLSEEGLSVSELGGIVPNPRLDKVYEGIRIGKENGMFDVTHGAGLAAIWSSWARYVYKNCLPRFVRFARNVMVITTSGTDAEIAEAGIAAMEQFFHHIGMPTNMRELGITPSDQQILEMADRCMAACGNRTGSAKKLTAKDAVIIYQNAR